MPSTYTTSLGLEMQNPGEGNNIWGTALNQVINSTEQAVAGYLAIDLTAGNVTLTSTFAVSNQARNMMLRFTGSPAAARTVTVPSVPKLYVFANTCGQAVTITTAISATTAAIPTGQRVVVMVDGTDCFLVRATDFGGNRLTSLLDPTGAQDAATKNYIDTKALNTFTVPSGVMSFNGQRLTNLGTPTAGTDAVTKTYADGLSFSSALPGQTGNATKIIGTDGTTASWQDPKTYLPQAMGATGVVPGTAGLVPAPPAGTITDYLGRDMTYRALPVSGIGRSTKSANYAMATADLATMIVCTGSWTLTFLPAATAGTNKFFYVSNAGTGVIALALNGAETIDGLTTFNIYPGEIRLVLCDGTAYYSSVLAPYCWQPSASGTWVKPPGYTFHDVECLGGAGGGGSGCRGAASTFRGGGQGGGGGYKTPLKRIRDAALPASVPFVIGAGGAGGLAMTVNSTSGNFGSDGGDTYFGSPSAPYAIAFRGRGGYFGTTASFANSNGGGALSANGDPLGPANVPNPFGASNNTSGPVASVFGGGQGDPANSTQGGGDSAEGGPGGGSGSTLTAANAETIGSAGGGTPIVGASSALGHGAIAPATANAPGNAGATGTGLAGTAGSGGRSGDTAGTIAGGKGGDGGPGAGGGGGGGSTNGANSGAGGKGGDGALRIVGVR